MKLNFPCSNHDIALEFGYDATLDPKYSTFYTLFDNKHPGVDFDLPEGTDIFAAFEGIVVRSENHKGMGNTIGIRNGNILALYAHLSETLVKLGDIISAGDLIGKSGNTGEATTKPHLHFELRDLRFKRLNEMVFKPEFEQEISNYSPEFIYKVNNLNTSKNFEKLSIMYFGTNSYSSKLHKLNNIDILVTDEIPQETEVLIPNYW